MTRLPEVVPLAAVVPTRNRPVPLARMLDSLARQDLLPLRVILVDASTDDTTRRLLDTCGAELRARGCELVWCQAAASGAAPQRNQGVALVREPVVAFFDDDILFEPGCIRRLWQALHRDPRLGGVNAMITNQSYRQPGPFSSLVLRIMAGGPRASYAGCLLGPSVNVLPEDRPDLPEVVPVEWLNTGCTLYRRHALPDPPFPDFFTGYSMGEDITLSVRVGRRWKLGNARTARIYHDTQGGDHKDDQAAVAKMSLVNRHYIMTRVLERRKASDYARLALYESFRLAACVEQNGLGRTTWRVLKGKCLGFAEIARDLSRSRVDA